MIATEYAYLTIVDDTPMIAGTRYKVMDIALDYLAYGWSPEEMHRQHPDLTKAQICSAMAFYYDHEQEIHNQIEREEYEIEEHRAKSKQLTKAQLLARIKS